MDYEQKHRRQTLKVIISEIFMVLVVIMTVVILAFLVSGYWLNEDFEVKRQGLLQIYSIPTGADVNIDGESSWLQRTNTSKVLQSGEHTIVLEKEGYDTWSKTINIKEGLLYRIHYPRLFLKDRVSEKLLATTGATFATVSPDHSSLILANETTEWSFINLDEEQLDPKKIDVKNLFSSVSLAPNATTGLFTGKIVECDWNLNGSRVLLKVNSKSGDEWVILNPKDAKNSINLTREFGADFKNVKIFDNDANTLLVVQNQNLHKVDVSGRSISSILVENVYDFDYYNNEIVFSALDKTTKTYYLGMMKIGDDKITKLETLSAPAKVATMRFYEDRYILTLVENKLSLFEKSELNKIASFELQFTPNTLKIGHDGEFIIASSGSNIATLDMESLEIREWSVEGKSFDWIDNSMIYTVSGGELIVYDFDGLNRRKIAKNVSDHFPAAITNNRYLYYFSDDNLVREWLIPR